MPRLGLVALVWIAAISPAHAQSNEMLNNLFLDPNAPGLESRGADFPRYPVDQDCTTPFGMRVRNLCISREQQSYNLLKRTWVRIPEQFRSMCTAQIAEIRPAAAYMALSECIETRLDQNAAQQERNAPQSFQP